MPFKEDDLADQDEWEPPDERWQICLIGGFVVNVAEADMKMVRSIIGNEGIDSVDVEDIYGDEAVIVVKHVVAIKQWTERGGQRYKKDHLDNDNFGDG